MANETISTSWDELAAIAIAEARLTAQNAADLTKLLTRYDLKTGEISARFPKFASQTAAALTQGNEVSNSIVSTTAVVLTPDVNASWGTTVTDVASMAAAEQDFTRIGRVAAQAILQKKNQDIFALFDGFSTSIGTTNTDITAATILTGVKKLRQKNAVGDIYLVFTPEVMEDVLTDLASASGGNTIVSDRLRDAIMAGELPVIHGVRPYVVTSGVSETGDVKCGLFVRDALGYAVQWDFKVEVARNARKIGWDVIVSSSYAVGELDDDMGVEIIADGADS